MMDNGRPKYIYVSIYVCIVPGIYFIINYQLWDFYNSFQSFKSVDRMLKILKKNKGSPNDDKIKIKTL